MSTQPQTTNTHRSLIIALFLVITIDTMGIGFVWPLFGPLFTGKTTTLFSSSTPMMWRNILYGITIGTASLFAFISAPILGDISDRIGRRKVLFFCLGGTVIGMLLSALGIMLNQVLLLIFSRAWLGAIAASQVVAQAAIIDISPIDKKSNHLGIISAANNIGFIFGPIISSLLIDKTIVSWFNITTPFYFAALLAIFSIIFLLLVYKEKNRVKHQFTQKKFVFIRAFIHKEIRTIAIIYLCLQIGWALYLQIIFLSLIQKYNYSERLLGYFLSWLGLVFCFNLLVMVRITTRFIPLRKIIYSALTLAAVCCLVTASHNVPIIIWASVLPMASVVALGSNAILTKLSNAAAEHEQGWAMGISNSLASLTWTITPIIVGVLLTFGFGLPLVIAGLAFFVGLYIAISQKI